MEKLLRDTTAYKIFTGDRRAGRLSHAYMLVFPDSKNMRGALKLFAAEFFGAEAGTPLCDRIANGSFSDFKLYPAQGEKLTADAVSALIEDSALRPLEGDKKLYAIADFDAASALIQNKLLKTLEEPPQGAHFLLGAASAAPVLDTVVSRVKTLTVPPFTPSQIYEALERKGHAEENRAAAESCGGILGVAEGMVAGGWFKDVRSAARELCRTLRVGDIGGVCARYGGTLYKTELLAEMQRQYFASLTGGDAINGLCPAAAVFASEKLNGAFADLKFNANFTNLLYDFLLKVAKENEKWQRLQR